MSSLMDRRRSLMAKGKEDSIVTNLRQYKEVVVTEDHDRSNRLVIQMEPFNTYSHPIIFVYPKNFPQNPPENSFTYLMNLVNSIGTDTNGILRSNGSIGVDGSLIATDSSNGTISIGGQYGVVRAGMTICVMILEVPA